MKLGENIEITFHRTVRVPDGRQPANLPPSLGRMEFFKVSEYAEKCPKTWEPEGYFVALHDTEALWISFHAHKHPVALLIGAGGINALTGEKLGTTLAKDNYLVTPPQPWIDGWKDQDGTVWQFVATPYKKGDGISVAEQLIGAESKTGALGIALFEPKDPEKLTPKILPHEGHTDSIYGEPHTFKYASGHNLQYGAGKICGMSVASTGADDGEEKTSCSASFHSGEMVLPKSIAEGNRNVFSKRAPATSLSEMGVGKGGKIIQKIYTDPHGLEAWNEKPSQTMAVYLVNAVAFEEITGMKVPAPVSSENYSGKWFGMYDAAELDVAGSGKFTGLKSAVFPASDLETEEENVEAVESE